MRLSPHAHSRAILRDAERLALRGRVHRPVRREIASLLLISARLTYDGGHSSDRYGEFFVVERPEEQKEALTSDFNCQYVEIAVVLWSRRG